MRAKRFTLPAFCLVFALGVILTQLAGHSIEATQGDHFFTSSEVTQLEQANTAEKSFQANIASSSDQNVLYQVFENPRFWAFIACLILYIFASAVFHMSKDKGNFKSNEFIGKILLVLNPIALTAGHFGKASLSRLQVTWFSFTVIYRLILDLFSGVGLSGLSNDILLLIGISATGTIASKGVALGKKRLNLDNWVWLRERGWLTIYEENTDPDFIKDDNKSRVKWSDLIMSDGEFDIYSFQLLVFSLFVGISIISTTISNTLAEFSLPQNFPEILGLSNFIYIGGKVIDVDYFTELNEKIDELRDLEETEKVLSVIKKSNAKNANEIIVTPEMVDFISKAKIAAGMLQAIYAKSGTGFGKEITNDDLLSKSKKALFAEKSSEVLNQ